MLAKKRMGVAPSISAASVSSSGTVMKNWRKRNVAVALAMSGIVRPVQVFSRPKPATMSRVGKMRTSTGSMSVRKMVRKIRLRRGKRK